MLQGHRKILKLRNANSSALANKDSSELAAKQIYKQAVTSLARCEEMNKNEYKRAKVLLVTLSSPDNT